MLLLGVILKLMEVANIRAATLFTASSLLVKVQASLINNKPPNHITSTQRTSWAVIRI
jgi:hypothetical protein